MYASATQGGHNKPARDTEVDWESDDEMKTLHGVLYDCEVERQRENTKQRHCNKTWPRVNQSITLITH